MAASRDRKSRQTRQKRQRKPNQPVFSREESASRRATERIIGRSQAAALGGDHSQSTFERHVALLGDSRLARLDNTLHRAMIFRQLQRDYGNRYVQRLIDHISRKRAEPVQGKLTVGPAGDKYEQEADLVAKEVMGSVSSTGQEGAQRQQPEEEELVQGKAVAQRQGLEDEEELLQGKSLTRRAQIPLEGGEVGADMESDIRQAKGGGRALPENLRSSMEGALGADFSGVRVHTGPEADDLNDSMGARAFTTGQDIFLKREEYNPGSSAGQELLAHEVTHVVQQNSDVLERHEIQREFNLSDTEKGLLTEENLAALTVDDCLTDRTWFSLVHGYCSEVEDNAENLQFLQDVGDWKGNQNNKLAQLIVEKYIEAGSPREVNIDGPTKDELIAAVTEAEENPVAGDVFDAAYGKIRHLVETDVLPRFKANIVDYV